MLDYIQKGRDITQFNSNSIYLFSTVYSSIVSMCFTEINAYNCECILCYRLEMEDDCSFPDSSCDQSQRGSVASSATLSRGVCHNY